MHRRRSSDASLSSIGAASDLDDGEKKKKMRNFFKNLIPKRRKAKLSSLFDVDNVSGAPWLPNQMRTGEAKEAKDGARADILDGPCHADLFLPSHGLSSSEHQRPKVPPRRHRHSPEKVPVSLGSSLDETLSPVGALQYSRRAPVIHSRTSSHSSGFEEGSSSLTETSDASTWKDPIPRIADRVEGPNWTGESLGFRASAANHVEREMAASAGIHPKTGKSGTSTSTDEYSLVFSPEISLSVDEVLGEYLASKGNPLTSFTNLEQGESTSLASASTLFTPPTQFFGSKDFSGILDSNELPSGEIIDSRAPTYSILGQEHMNVEQETRQLMISRNTDNEAFSEHSKAAPYGNLQSNSTTSDRNNNRFNQDGESTNNESCLGSDGSLCNETSKEREESFMETEIHERDGYNQFNGEKSYIVEASNSAELLPCAAFNESTFPDSPQTSSVEETFNIRRSTTPSTRNDSLSSSTSSSYDRDSLMHAIPDRDLAPSTHLVNEKTVNRAKDKPVVAPKPLNRGGNSPGSRLQFQSPGRTSSSTTDETASPRSSQTELESRGVTGRRKNVSFVVNDDDFGRYVSKPHGVEAKMVLPFTERQKLPDFGGKTQDVTAAGKSWTERNFPPPKKPTIQGGFPRQSKPGNTRPPESQSTMTNNHQSVVKCKPMMRRHSDRRDRLASDVTDTLGPNHDVSKTSNKADRDQTGTRFTEHHSEANPLCVEDYLETRSVNSCNPRRDPFKSVARVPTGPRNSSVSNSVSSNSKAYGERRQSSPAERVFERRQNNDNSDPWGNLTTSNSSRVSRSRTKDSTERVASVQPLHRGIQQGRCKSETSQRDVETDLNLAKKFEAFNVRLAAMASAAAAKRSPSSIYSDAAQPFDDLRKGKWMSTDGIFEEAGGYDESRAASVFAGESRSLWTSEKQPVFRESDYHRGSLDPGTTRGIYRSRSEADDDMKAKYSCFLESRSRLFSHNTKSADGDGESSEDNPDWNNISSVSSETEQEQRLSSSYADLNCGNRGDEFASRARNHRGRDRVRLEASDTHKSGSDRGLFRSHSKGEYDQLNSKPRKTLQEQGEELQRQFSSWHRLLIAEKSQSFFEDSEKNDEKGWQLGSALLSGSYQQFESLTASSEGERLRSQSAERIPVRMGTKPIVRRPMAERKEDQEKSLDSFKRMSWQVPYDSTETDWKEVASSAGSLDKTSGGRPLRRSVSCAQPQRDLFPRLAMAKFNEDGTPRSILKKSNVARTQSAPVRAVEEENDDDDVDFDLEEADNTADVLPDSSTLPPLPSTAPPDLPPHCQTIPEWLTPSYLPQSPNLSVSSPPRYPSSHGPTQNRTYPIVVPPLPSSSPTRHQSPFPPPIPPRRPPSFLSSTLLPSSPQPPSKSPSPLPPPLPSSSPPPLPCGSINSDVSPPTVSPASDLSNSSFTWSPDSGSSKFLGLQNLQKRTAILRNRSRSDLGATASILNALSQH